MSSSISGIGSNNAMMMQGMRGMKRPDPAQMAENLFSKLDTSGQGYIEKADLQAAFDKVSASSSSSAGTSSSVDDLFSQLDTNSDGKVTKQEFSDTLRKVAEQLDNQFMSMRMNGAMRPPPPPQGGNGDSGFTKEELSSQLKAIDSTDSQRSSTLANIIGNFDKADTDGNGKVSFKEAMAYEQKTASTATATSSATGSSATGADASSQVMMQIMRLMQAYNIGNEQNDNSLASTLSVTA